MAIVSIPIHVTTETLHDLISKAKAQDMSVEEFCLKRITAKEAPVLNYVQEKEND